MLVYFKSTAQQILYCFFFLFCVRWFVDLFSFLLSITFSQVNAMLLFLWELFLSNFYFFTCICKLCLSEAKANTLENIT